MHANFSWSGLPTVPSLPRSGENGGPFSNPSTLMRFTAVLTKSRIGQGGRSAQSPRVTTLCLLEEHTNYQGACICVLSLAFCISFAQEALTSAFVRSAIRLRFVGLAGLSEIRRMRSPHKPCCVSMCQRGCHFHESGIAVDATPR